VRRVWTFVLDDILGRGDDSMWVLLRQRVVVIGLAVIVFGALEGSFGARIVAVLFGAAFIVLATLPRLIRRRIRPTRHGGHAYRVIQPDGEVFFYAECDCGWIDVPLDSGEEARAAVEKHTDDAAPDIEEIVVPTG
jgi:hypothetical protein